MSNNDGKTNHLPINGLHRSSRFPRQSFGWLHGFIPGYKSPMTRHPHHQSPSCIPPSPPPPPLTHSPPSGTIPLRKNEAYWFNLAVERNLPSQTSCTGTNYSHDALAAATAGSSSYDDGGYVGHGRSNTSYGTTMAVGDPASLFG